MDKRKRTVLRIGFFSVKNIVKIALYILIVYLVISICKSAFSFGYAVFNQEPIAETYGMDVTVEIPVGASAAEIGSILEDNGLIRDGKLFILQEFLSNYHGRIQDGTYVLNTSQTVDEMIVILGGGVSEEDESR